MVVVSSPIPGVRFPEDARLPKFAAAVPSMLLINRVCVVSRFTSSLRTFDVRRRRDSPLLLLGTRAMIVMRRRIIPDGSTVEVDIFFFLLPSCSLSLSFNRLTAINPSTRFENWPLCHTLIINCNLQLNHHLSSCLTLL